MFTTSEQDIKGVLLVDFEYDKMISKWMFSDYFLSVLSVFALSENRFVKYNFFLNSLQRGRSRSKFKKSLFTVAPTRD